MRVVELVLRLPTHMLRDVLGVYVGLHARLVDHRGRLGLCDRVQEPLDDVPEPVEYEAGRVDHSTVQSLGEIILIIIYCQCTFIYLVSAVSRNLQHSRGGLDELHIRVAAFIVRAVAQQGDFGFIGG